MQEDRRNTVNHGPGRQSQADWVREALDAHEGALIAYARRLLGGDLERARDVTQETFLRLCRTRREELHTGLREWLFTVCRNLALDVTRKEARMSVLNEQEVELRASAAPAPGSELEAEDSVRHALTMIEQLPEKQREVLQLKFQHGLSYKSIAGVTGETVGSVGWLIHVAMKALRSQMTAEGAEGARG